MDRPVTSRMVQEAKRAVASSAPTAAIPAFLQKLCEILEKSPQDVVSWLPHGRSFIVKNVKRFSAEVLSKSFKSANFASFVRQLNFYGFHKIAGETKEVWEFHHDKFRRDLPALLYEIRRKTSADYVAPEQSDLIELKGEVSTLRAQVSMLTKQLSAVLGVLQNVAPGAMDQAGLTGALGEVGAGSITGGAGAASSGAASKSSRSASSKGGKKGGAAGRRGRSKKASSSHAVAEKRRRDVAVSEDADESGAEAVSARARTAYGATAATVTAAKVEAEAKPWVPVATAGVGSGAAAPYGGELPSDLVASFQSNLDLGDAPMEAVGPIDLTSWLDEADEADESMLGAGVGAGMEVDASSQGLTSPPPALQRSLSTSSVSQYFNTPQSNLTAEGPATRADLPTQAVLGATSTLLNQLGAAGFLTSLMAASAANGAAAGSAVAGLNTGAAQGGSTA
mmetsp:Transcript_61832/g.149708  ORF Transcript_61832/g.149708 Transcript_61832/m.149708 type:complete len:452 (-) Transcript_61832:85-1440(-)